MRHIPNEDPKDEESTDAIARLTEWQEHQYDPGYRIGLGRVRRPMEDYHRFPAMYFASAVFWIFTGTIVLVCAENRTIGYLSAAITYPYALYLICKGIKRIAKKG